MTELLLCPFCGSKAEMGYYSIWCTECGAEMRDYHYDKAPIEAWNKRLGQPYDLDSLPKERTCSEVLVDKHFRGCSECGYMWEFMYSIGKKEGPQFCPKCGSKVVNKVVE